MNNQPAPRRSLIPSRSIRTRLFILAAAMMLVAVGVLLVTALTSANNVIQTAQNTAQKGLRDQTITYLTQLNRSIAERNALVLDRGARDISTIADAASAIYSQAMDLQPVSTILQKGPEGQYLNSAADISSIFIPTIAISRTLKNAGLSLALNRDIEQGAYLDLSLISVKENNPNAAAVYLGTKNEVLRYYPNIEIGKVVPSDFLVTERPWYKAALEGNPDPANLRPIWSAVYFDATGLGLMTTIAMPVYDRHNTLVGVAGLDLTIAEIQANLRGSSVSGSDYSFLIDERGVAVILPPQGWRDLLGREPDSQNPMPNLIGTVSDENIAAIIQRMIRGESGYQTVTVRGQEYELAYSPFKGAGQELSQTGWSLATLIPTTNVLRSVADLEAQMRVSLQGMIFTRILPIVMLEALALIILAWVGTRSLSAPILKLSQSAQKFAAGNWEEPLPELRRLEQENDNEYGLLARTLASMAVQLRQTFTQLEQRVSERTLELEQRTVQLQTTAEIARDITQAKDLESMLDSAAALISRRYGAYMVGVWLVDETSEYAHLKAAGGAPGATLLERQMRLRVGQEGIIGYVTRFGQVRLSADVRTDRLFLADPALPETRSELAIPLRVGPKIIGALDIHNTRPLAFSEDDITALKTLADQLAIAIENVRLVARLQTTLEETSRIGQQQTRQAWEQMTGHAGAAQYEYNLLEVKKIRPTHTTRAGDTTGPEGFQEPALGKHGRILQMPVALRDQVIGVIGIESDSPDHTWSDDEVAILQATANQAALSVENARLLADSQQRAMREQLAAEVTTQMRASLDMETVLQTSIRELAQRMGIAEVEVRLGEPEPYQAQHPTDSSPQAGEQDAARPQESPPPPMEAELNGIRRHSDESA